MTKINIPEKFNSITDVQIVQGDEENKSGDQIKLEKMGYTIRPINIKQYTGV